MPLPTNSCGEPEKERSRRFQSAADLAFALRNLAVSTSGISGAPAIAPSAIAKPWRIGAARMVGVALAAAAIGAGGAYWLISHAKPPQPPTFQEILPLKQGHVSQARFLADGKSILYSLATAGDPRESKIYSLALEKGQPREVPLQKGVRLSAISSQQEIAGFLDSSGAFSTRSLLFRAPLSGGGLRQVLDGVLSADWSPDGNRLAVVRQIGKSRRIEYPIGHPLLEWHKDGYPDKCRVSPDGECVAFSVHYAPNRHSIYVVDQNGKVDELARLKAEAEGYALPPLAWSPDGREVWFSAFNFSDQGAIYAAGLNHKLRLVTRLPGRTTLQDVSANAKILFSTLSTIDTNYLNTSKGRYPTDLSLRLTPDGRFYAGTNRAGSGDGSIYWGRTDGSSPIRLAEGIYGAPSPDGRWVLVYRRDDSCWIVPTGPGEERRLNLDRFDAKSRDVQLWFSDSRHLLVSGTAAGKPAAYYRMDVSDTSLQELPTKYEEDVRMLSPDDQLLYTGFQRTARLRKMSGGEPFEIPGLLPTDYVIGWAEDSKSMWISSARVPGASFPVYRLNIVTGERRLWREFDSPVQDISLDGKTYLSATAQSFATLNIMEGVK